jgi:hypothetical protein
VVLIFITFFGLVFVWSAAVFHALILARPHLGLLGGSVPVEVEVAFDPHLRDFSHTGGHCRG